MSKNLGILASSKLGASNLLSQFGLLIRLICWMKDGMNTPNLLLVNTVPLSDTNTSNSEKASRRFSIVAAVDVDETMYM